MNTYLRDKHPVFVVTGLHDQDELYHYGIKGMKWGVRRYRNEDGSLTPAGKKREKQLAEYKKKETARLDKIYDTKKYDDRVKKYQEKYVDTGKERYLKKIDEAQFKKYQAIGLKAVENSSIKNMTYEQMKDEKRAVMINTGRNIVRAASTAGIAIGGIVGGKLANDANKLADKINNNRMIRNFDTLSESYDKFRSSTDKTLLTVTNEVLNNRYTEVIRENGISGKILDKTLNATDTLQYANAGKGIVSWVAQDALDKVTAAGYLGGPTAAAVKLGSDIVNGRYKSNASVKSRQRLSYQDKNKVDEEARKKVDELKKN